VFVLGSPRSGTTLLYHMLLSAGNFAIYRAESEALHLLEPRFGNLCVERNKRRLMQAWLKTRLFAATGLDAAPLQERVMAECHNGGDFLRIVMEETARRQGVARWAECTPDHLLYLPRIKQTIPEALVIHIIRDGRDVALSMERQNYPRKLPWDMKSRRMAAGLYWEWMVRKGREHGRELGPDYIEVHYEDLVTRPQFVLDQLSAFVGQVLDYEQIQRVGIGSVSQPNTSFKAEAVGEGFSPVGRWKKHFTPGELTMFEDLLGDALPEFGYTQETKAERGRVSLRMVRAQYRAFFDAKLYLRTRTPLGRLLVTRDLSRL
jgi:Sulfotransferase family